MKYSLNPYSTRLTVCNTPLPTPLTESQLLARSANYTYIVKDARNWDASHRATANSFLQKIKQCILKQCILNHLEECTLNHLEECIPTDPVTLTDYNDETFNTGLPGFFYHLTNYMTDHITEVFNHNSATQPTDQTMLAFLKEVVTTCLENLSNDPSEVRFMFRTLSMGGMHYREYLDTAEDFLGLADETQDPTERAHCLTRANVNYMKAKQALSVA